MSITNRYLEGGIWYSSFVWLGHRRHFSMYSVIATVGSRKPIWTYRTSELNEVHRIQYQFIWHLFLGTTTSHIEVSRIFQMWIDLKKHSNSTDEYKRCHPSLTRDEPQIQAVWMQHRLNFMQGSLTDTTVALQTNTDVQIFQPSVRYCIRA